MSAETPTFESVWQTGREFLARFTPGKPAKFFHPVSDDWSEPPHMTVGALLSVTLRFIDRDADFHVHARLVAKHLNLPHRGLMLELLLEERERLELILTCVTGESFPYFKRRFVRLAARVPVKVIGPGGIERDVVSTTLNEGGMHLAITDEDAEEGGPDAPFDVGARLKLLVSWPSGTVHALAARLAEVIPRGPQRGLGVEFLFASAEQREEVAAEVAVVRAKHGSGA